MYLTGYSGSMKWYEEPFKGKKITVLGLGLLGRGVGDVDFLAKCGAEVLVTDKKNGSELAASVEKLKQYSNVQFKLGGHDPEDFKHCDMVLKAAGVRLDSPEVAVARAASSISRSARASWPRRSTSARRSGDKPKRTPRRSTKK